MKQHLKSIFSIACASAVALSFGMTAAHADEPTTGLYIGTALGYNKSSNLNGRIDGALSTQGIGSTTSSGNTNVTPNFKLGYIINPSFAIEASYDSVGAINLQSSISSPAADTALGTWKATGMGLHMLGISPLYSQWSIVGRVGYESWKSTLNLTSNAGGTTAVATTSTNGGLVLGAGLSYAMSKNVDATGDFIHYFGVGNNATTGQSGINTFNVGMRYHF